jgi:hypothetical protein
VYLYVNGVRRDDFGRTDAKGNYKFTRTVRTGQRTFQTKVIGRIRGVHPNIKTCLNAWSNVVTVRVKYANPIEGLNIHPGLVPGGCLLSVQ